MSTNSVKALVSVVITTKNEEKNIALCLQSVANQTYKSIEILVVDNFSTDRTQEMARQYTPLVFNKGPERSAQRNYGMLEKAQGEFVIFIDADMILHPELIAACVNRLENNSEIALHIPEIILGKGFWSHVRRFERRFYDGTVVDGARFFRREVLRNLGGFDENLYAAEDWDLDKRLKQRGRIGLLVPMSVAPVTWELAPVIEKLGVNPLMYGPVIFHNESEFHLSGYLKKKNYYVQNFSYYISKWGKSDPDIKKQFGAFYRMFLVFTEKGKWKRLLCSPVLTLGMFFLRVFVGVVFLLRKS